MAQITTDIPREQSDNYKEILTPKKNKSYCSDVFRTFDHDFINITESYNKATDGTWKGGKIAKATEVFFKFIAIAAVTIVKIPLAVTVITPAVLQGVSMYKNSKIAAASLNLEKKAVAFVKASEAHMALGNLNWARVTAGSADPIALDASQKNVVKIATHNAHVKAAANHKLIETSDVWAAVIQDTAQKRFSNDPSERLAFLHAAVESLVSKGESARADYNRVNANLAIANVYLSSTIKELEETGAVTMEGIKIIANDYLKFTPASVENSDAFVYIRTAITSNQKIQSAAATRRENLKAQIKGLKDEGKIKTAVADRLASNQQKLTTIREKIDSNIKKIDDAKKHISAIFNDVTKKIGKASNNVVFDKAMDSKPLCNAIDLLYGTKKPPGEGEGSRQPFNEIICTPASQFSCSSSSESGAECPEYTITHSQLGSDRVLQINDETGQPVNAGLEADNESLVKELDDLSGEEFTSEHVRAERLKKAQQHENECSDIMTLFPQTDAEARTEASNDDKGDDGAAYRYSQDSSSGENASLRAQSMTAHREWGAAPQRDVARWLSKSVEPHLQGRHVAFARNDGPFPQTDDDAEARTEVNKEDGAFASSETFFDSLVL